MAKGQLPETFEGRGTAVPLHLRDFAHTRVRNYGKKSDRFVLEASVPNLSGTRKGEFVVIPWEQFAGFAPFAERDKELIEKIGASGMSKGIDPINIRSIALAVDAKYHPDEEKRSDAEKEKSRDDEERELVRYSCIAQLTRECGIDQGDKFMAKANTKTLLDLLRGGGGDSFNLNLLIDKVMSYAAAKTETSVKEVRERLEPLVGMIAPFGTIPAEGEEKTDGFLYRQHIRLIGFRKQLSGYSSTSDMETQEMIQPILDNVDQCIHYVNWRVDELNHLLGSLAGVLDGFEGSISRMESLRREVAYALDGWDDYVRIWDEVWEGKDLVGGGAGIERAIKHISEYMSAIPVRELHPEMDLMEKARKLEGAKYQMIREMVDWETNALDTELHARVQRSRELEED